MTQNDKIDILAFGAHPDDVEAGAGGILIKAKRQGFITAIIDLSAGEMGTQGDQNIRAEESLTSAKILQLDSRKCLNLPDANIKNNPQNRKKIINLIRRHTPQTILVPYWEDRHPDHVAASQLVTQSIFCSELGKMKTQYPPFRPEKILYYMIAYEFEPSFILDITEEFTQKLAAIKAYKSQFISNLNRIESIEFWEHRARFYGSRIGVKYGEPFKTQRLIGLSNITDITPNYF
jgi:bacillithiol biosynthesis deacetylase BshB1